MNTSTRNKVITPGVVAALLIGGAVYYFRDNLFSNVDRTQNTNTVVRTASTTYPAGWTPEPLTSADRLAGLILKVGREKPTAALTIRTIIGQLESGLNVGATADQVVDSLKKEVGNFSLVDKKTSRLKSYDTIQIRYRQGSPPDQGTAENWLTILLTQHQTFYVTVRAAETDFRAIETDANKMLGGFATYLHSQGLQ